MAPQLEARNLSKSFLSGGRRLEVLAGVDLALEAGEMVAVVGASGAGKSTLLHILGGVDRPSSGEVLFEGESLSRMSEGALARFRNAAVGFVFQFHFLMPDFTALENVMMPLLVAGRRRSGAAARAAGLLGEVGLSERVGHRPGELSGGEQQRVAIARAMAREPRVLLADEPTGNLDGLTGDAVFSIIRGLNREQGLTTVLVTHNDSLAAAAHRVLRLTEGRLLPA